MHNCLHNPSSLPLLLMPAAQTLPDTRPGCCSSRPCVFSVRFPYSKRSTREASRRGTRVLGASLGHSAPVPISPPSSPIKDRERSAAASLLFPVCPQGVSDHVCAPEFCLHSSPCLLQLLTDSNLFPTRKIGDSLVGHTCGSACECAGE